MTTTLTTTARCYECAWTETGPDADKAAERHMKRTGHHSTGTRSTPIHADAMSAPVREGQK